MPRLLFKLKNSRTTGRNGKFNFDVALSMKDREETFTLDEEFQTINLLSKIAIEKYKNKRRYTRFGVTQVALEPLTTSGLDCPIFTAFRDNRLRRHKDSLLAMIRMNILDGPIYFNCCPNYSVDLNDPLIIDILLSDIHHPNIHKKKDP